MRSPKNRLKLTGDTHPPEVEFDLGADDDAALDAIAADDEAQSRIYADGFVPADEQAEAGSAQGAFETMPRRSSSTPWVAVGAVLAVGFLVSRLLRR